MGIVMQGGMYNGVMRALQFLGLADVYGDSSIPLYVMNVTYPMIDEEVAAFCAGKRAVIMVERDTPLFWNRRSLRRFTARISKREFMERICCL